MSKTKRTHDMKRNPFNTNQRLHNEAIFYDAPINTNNGCLIANHLQRMHNCINASLKLHKRISLMRCDLYIPLHASFELSRNNEVISRFIASLHAQIECTQAQSRLAGDRVHDADMRYMWCREASSNGRVHYHVALLFNHAAYAFMGHFNVERSNMYARIHRAWASALTMYIDDVIGEIHIPSNPVYQIVRGDEDSFNTAFYRVSYFAKMDTKEYGGGIHTFGCSKSRREVPCARFTQDCP